VPPPRVPLQALPPALVLEKALLAQRRAPAEPLPRVLVPLAQQVSALAEQLQPAHPPASSAQLSPQHPSRLYPL